MAACCFAAMHFSAWLVPLAAPADHLAVIAHRVRCGQQPCTTAGRTTSRARRDALNTLGVAQAMSASPASVAGGGGSSWRAIPCGRWPWRRLPSRRDCHLSRGVGARQRPCDGEPRGELGNMLLKDARAACRPLRRRSRRPSLAHVIRLQRDGSIHLLLEHDAHESTWRSCAGWSRDGAPRARPRRAARAGGAPIGRRLLLDDKGLAGKRRRFWPRAGAALPRDGARGDRGRWRAAATIHLDDKGMVLIWFGLPQNSSRTTRREGCSRAWTWPALSTRHQLRTRTGITSGVAFCGLGSHYRHEFSVMGPSVNGGRMCLCRPRTRPPGNDELHELVLAGRSSETRTLCLPRSPPIQVKTTDRVTTSGWTWVSATRRARLRLDGYLELPQPQRAAHLPRRDARGLLAGAQIVKQGEHGESYVIITAVDVTQRRGPEGEQGEEEVFLRRLGRGQHFGELALREHAALGDNHGVRGGHVPSHRPRAFQRPLWLMTHLLRRKYRDQQQSRWPLASDGGSRVSVRQRRLGLGWQRQGWRQRRRRSVSSPLGIRGAAPASPGLPPSRRLRQILERCGRKAEGGLLSAVSRRWD